MPSPPRQGPTLAGRVRNFANMYKAYIDIDLKGPQSENYISCFSTYDKIDGTVSITASNDCRFDEVEIALVGLSLLQRLLIRTTQC